MSNSPKFEGLSSLLSTWKNLDLRQLKLHWLSILAALCATGLAIIASWNNDHPNFDAIVRLLSTIVMGISLFVLPSLVFDEQKEAKKRLMTILALAALLIVYYVFSQSWSNAFFFYKTLQGFVLFHLLVSLAPYFRNRNLSEDEFWSSNWFLLNRFHMAVTQSVLLLIGLFLALLSINHLFDTKIQGEVFRSAAAVIIFFISVIIFVGSLGDRKEIVEPAEILKRLVRTVLTPLALAYFAILYAYTVKLGIAREWPRGGLGLMVSGLALIVTLSYVIMRPLAASNEFGPRIKAFWNWSFRLLIGPVVLVMLGLGRRVSDYGWTEQRAALGYLAIWMLGIAIYYWHPNRRRLVGIPLSLTIVLLMTWFGPLSPTSVGERSQTSHLAELLAKDRASLTFEDKKRVNSIVRTLCETNGVDSMARAASVTVNPHPATGANINLNRYGSTDFIRMCDDGIREGKVVPGPISQALAQLGVPEIESYETSEQKSDVNFQRSNEHDIVFEKYETSLFSFDDWRKPVDPKVEALVEQQRGSLKLRMVRKPFKLEWEAAPGTWRKFDLAPAIDSIKAVGDKTETPDETSKRLRVVDTYRGRKVELQIISAQFYEGDYTDVVAIQIRSLVARPTSRQKD